MMPFARGFAPTTVRVNIQPQRNTPNACRKTIMMKPQFFASLALACALASGCGPIEAIKDGTANGKAVSDELEKSLGVKSFVGFQWTNGVLVSVSVNFQGVPTNTPLPEIAEKTKRSVVDHFKQAPKQIVIAFVFTG